MNFIQQAYKGRTEWYWYLITFFIIFIFWQFIGVIPLSVAAFLKAGSMDKFMEAAKDVNSKTMGMLARGGKDYTVMNIDAIKQEMELVQSQMDKYENDESATGANALMVMKARFNLLMNLLQAKENELKIEQDIERIKKRYNRYDQDRASWAEFEKKLRKAALKDLDAEIALILSGNESASNIKVKLAPPEKFDEAGIPWSYFLSKIQFKPIVRPDGSVVVQLSSNEALSEPFLDFLLDYFFCLNNILSGCHVLGSFLMPLFGLRTCNHSGITLIRI